jgi:hypothetical protein
MDTTHKPGRHTNPERMKITVPAGYTPAYFMPVTAIRATICAGLADSDPNEWVCLGTRDALVILANRVAHMHFDTAVGVR